MRGYREGDNPASWSTLKYVLSKPSKSHKVCHYAALPWQEAPSFLAGLREVGTVAAKALEFVILTAARSGEVRQATWEEIDLDARLSEGAILRARISARKQGGGSGGNG